MFVKISFFQFLGTRCKKIHVSNPTPENPAKTHLTSTLRVCQILHLAGDPRSEEISGFRAYSLGLNIRGRSALQHWPGLWERVAEKVVFF